MAEQAGLELDTAGVVAPPPLIYLSGLALAMALQKWGSWPRLPAWSRWLGIPSIGAGGALIGLAMRELRRADTEVEPWKPTTAIVSSGPYRLSRNPIYVGLSAIYLGIALITRSLWAAILFGLVVSVMRRGVIDREERYLSQRFGDEYLSYRAAVRRWL